LYIFFAKPLYIVVYEMKKCVVKGGKNALKYDVFAVFKGFFKT